MIKNNQEDPIFQDVFAVSDIETLKAISDPLRIQILDNIRLANKKGENRTVKQLSKILDLPTSKLYYHINILEKHGLIYISETQLVSGIVEKHYHLTANDIVVSRQLFASELIKDEEMRALITLVDITLESTRAAYLSLLNSVGTEREIPIRLQGRRGHVSRNLVQMTPNQAETFYARLLDLLEEFNQQELHSDEENYVFNLTTVFIPLQKEITLENIMEEDA